MNLVQLHPQKGGEEVETDPRIAFIGKPCIYVDELSVDRPALITAVHGLLEDKSEPWSVNLVYVNDSINATDQYGRQIVHKGSVPNRAKSGVNGNCFRMS